MDDKRYKVELPSGIIKRPKLEAATCDLSVNDVVVMTPDGVAPMYSEDQQMYGVCAASGKKGGKVLVAT